MSGQASRSRVLAVQRHRRQVARELALSGCVPNVRSDACADIPGIASQLLNGGFYFDVHAAREHARSLIALEAEQGAFEDWTRTMGLGPENREAFAKRIGVWSVEIEQAAPGEWSLSGDRGARYHASQGDDIRTIEMGLGSAWGSRQTPPSGFAVYSETPCKLTTPEGSSATITESSHFWMGLGGWPGNLAAQWARQGGDRRAPMGRSLARLGRRILDALEGQPSECGHWTANDGQTMRTVIVAHVPTVIPCGCHGTGHNLRGVLPPIEWSPAVRRRAADSYQAAWGQPRGRRDCWLGRIVGGVVYPSDRVRVVPRGEHRNPSVEVVEHNGRRVALRDQVRGWVPPSIMGQYPGKHLVPRWRQGELLHAEQRRERARRAQRPYDAEMDEHRLTATDVL